MFKTQNLTIFENHFPANNISDLIIYHNGRQQCLPGEKNVPCVQSHYLFNLIIRGKGVLRVDNSVYHLSGGRGFLVQPGQFYQCTADTADPWEYIWVGFGGESAKDMLYNSRLIHSNPIYASDAWEQLYEYMASSVTAVRQGAPGTLVYCQGMLLLIIAHLLSKTMLIHEPRDLTQYSDIQQDYIRRAILYIQEHLSSFFTVDDVASFLGLNRSHFSRIFTRICGIAPSRFIENYRLDNAWHILRHTDMPIAKIGQEVGYRDPAYFTRRFQERYGTSPSVIRESGNWSE